MYIYSISYFTNIPIPLYYKSSKWGFYVENEMYFVGTIKISPFTQGKESLSRNDKKDFQRKRKQKKKSVSEI